MKRRPKYLTFIHSSLTCQNATITFYLEKNWKTLLILNKKIKTEKLFHLNRKTRKF